MGDSRHLGADELWRCRLQSLWAREWGLPQTQSLLEVLTGCGWKRECELWSQDLNLSCAAFWLWNVGQVTIL